MPCEEREKTVVKTIKARIKGRMIEPLEALELPEDGEVTVTIEYEPPGRRTPGERFKAAAGRWDGLVDAEALKRSIYRDRLVSSRRTVRG
ncbi:MAG: hypothetical protein FJ279_14160 [Planctomycetes bacterium]|nr:hypothetical protein [Planctomycetota bacterium]MBM4079640.1 hypothetical protein [Planctomycetota bacterium]MBM4084236.1 hypothetical protein [Planctomycetota bacterium]